jgi:hypothetical protein
MIFFGEPTERIRRTTTDSNSSVTGGNVKLRGIPLKLAQTRTCHKQQTSSRQARMGVEKRWPVLPGGTENRPQHKAELSGSAGGEEATFS